jgi:hypothetical protein
MTVPTIAKMARPCAGPNNRVPPSIGVEYDRVAATGAHNAAYNAVPYGTAAFHAMERSSMTGWPRADKGRPAKSRSSSTSAVPAIQAMTSVIDCPPSFAKATTSG